MDTDAISMTTPYLPEVTDEHSDEQIRQRLRTYWQALGVSDIKKLLALSEQSVQRLTERGKISELDPMSQAILAANDVLDQWLVVALNLPIDAPTLIAARAALLSGAIADWSKLMFAPAEQARTMLLAQLPALIAEPVPETHTGVMPAQRIELLSLFSPLRRWLRQPADT